MQNISIFVLGFVGGVAVCWLFLRYRYQKGMNSSRGERGSDREDSSGLTGINAKRAQEKEDAKARILALAGRQVEISNNDVERLLSISDSTATNYLSELEGEGKLVQVGIEGRSVRYRRAPNG